MQKTTNNNYYKQEIIDLRESLEAMEELEKGINNVNKCSHERILKLF